MKPAEKQIISLCIKMMQAPRTRFGKIEFDSFTMSRLHKLADESGYLQLLPHGGSDGIDKAAMILQAVIGDDVASIMDMGRRKS